MKFLTHSVLARYFVVVIIIPFLVQYTFYYRYTPNYYVNMFSKEYFKQGYESDVFKYRIIGRELHLWTYSQLSGNAKVNAFADNEFYGKRLLALDERADRTFYLTYFLLAYLFTALTALILLLIFDMSFMKELESPQKIFIMTFLILLIGFTQFVVTPYDNPSYFFLVLSIYLYLNWVRAKSIFLLILFYASIILSTLNKESFALGLSFIAAISISKFGLWNIRWIRSVIGPLLCFIGTYAVLHILLPGKVQIVQGPKIFDNINILKPARWMGILFGITTIYLILNLSTTPGNKRLIWHYLFAASPYIFLIIAVGILIEFRLWVPVILPAVVLSRIDLKKFEASLDSGKSDGFV